MTTTLETRTATHADLIAEAYARFQAAERAFYENALFPAFGAGIEVKPGWKAELRTLREDLMRTRDQYFAALTTPWIT